jgi:RimJ/RimL family protein N-acetyltransferase
MKRPAGPFLTERLVLRTFETDDLDALHAMFGDPRVTRFLDHGPLTREATQGLLTRISGFTAFDAEGRALRLAAVLQETGEVIGDFSLWSGAGDPAQGEIGFVLHPDQQGRGFALEAAQELLRIGFEDAGLHRIIGRCDAGNAASVGLMRRLGMREDAHFRENEGVKGEWADELVFAIHADEWAAR